MKKQIFNRLMLLITVFAFASFIFNTGISGCGGGSIAKDEIQENLDQVDEVTNGTEDDQVDENIVEDIDEDGGDGDSDGDGDGDGDIPDPLEITNNIPTADATHVPVNTNISVTFNKDINVDTLNDITFIIAGAESGEITYNPETRTATFDPDEDLLSETIYTVTITIDLLDTDGMHLDANFEWTFITLDIGRPVIIDGSQNPADGAEDVSVNTNVSVVFLEPIDCESAQAAGSFILIPFGMDAEDAISATVTCPSPDQIVLDPDEELLSESPYTAIISYTVTDEAGNPIGDDEAGNIQWSFKTEDATQPEIDTYRPNGIDPAPINSVVDVYFTEDIDCDTINAESFILEQSDGTPVEIANILCEYDLITLIPLDELLPETNYAAYLTNAITDLSGNPLNIVGEVFSWEFTTGGNRIIHVSTIENDIQDGRSWQTAFNSLANALEIADGRSAEPAEGDHIWVAQGTYYPDTEGLANPREAIFTIPSGVRMYGRFPTYGGDGTFAARNIDRYKTILSGNIGDPEIDTDNCYHVVLASGTNEETVLNGFDITKGYANFVEDLQIFGGGAINTNSAAQFINITFIDNYALLYGGAIYNNISTSLFENIIFQDNTSYLGGAVFNNSSATLFSLVEFNNNSSIDTGIDVVVDNGGGAMFNSGDFDGIAPSINQATFNGNTSSNIAGAIYNYESNVTINESEFTDNSARTGGAIYNDTNCPVITNSGFIRNHATSVAGAGAIYNDNVECDIEHAWQFLNFEQNYAPNIGALGNYNSTLFLQNAMFYQNHADRSDAGAIFNATDSGLLITNSAFIENEAETNCAAICNSGTILLVINTTIANNTSSNEGTIRNIGLAEANLTNMILWGNIPADNQIRSENPDLVRIAYSIIEGAGTSEVDWNVTFGVDADENIDEDPLFDVKYNLTTESPGIDSASHDVLGFLLEVDLNNEDRLVDIPDIGTTILDRGAYEFQP